MTQDSSHVPFQAPQPQRMFLVPDTAQLEVPGVVDRGVSPTGSVDPLLETATPSLPPRVAKNRFDWKKYTRSMPFVLKRGVIRWLTRSGVVFLFILVFFLFLVILKMQAKPDVYDYSKVTFPWKIDPRTYLKPWNATFGSYNVLMDAHVHTTLSDGQLEPEQVVEWAIAHGYNAIAVTDHNTVDGARAAKRYAEQKYGNQFVVITGQEFSCCRIHMNILGVNETIIPPSAWPTDDDLKSVIAKVHSLGGIAIVNHIWWSNRTTQPYQEATLPNHPLLSVLDKTIGIDGVEIINGNTVDALSQSYVLNRTLDGKQLVMVAGSDMHQPDGAYAWTLLQAREPITEASILEGLKTARTTFMMDAAGTRPRSYPPISSAFAAYAPLGLLADYFQTFITEYHGMYSFVGPFCHEKYYHVEWAMLGWFFFWVILLTGFAELLWTVVKLGVKWCAAKGMAWWRARSRRPREPSAYSLHAV